MSVDGFGEHLKLSPVGYCQYLIAYIMYKFLTPPIFTAFPKLITACHILLGSVDCWAGSRSRPQVLKTDVTGLLKWAISSAPLPPAAVARTVLSCLPRGTCDSSRAPTACKIRLRWHIAGIVAAFRSILGWDFHFWGATRNLSLET